MKRQVGGVTINWIQIQNLILAIQIFLNADGSRWYSFQLRERAFCVFELLHYWITGGVPTFYCYDIQWMQTQKFR